MLSTQEASAAITAAMLPAKTESVPLQRVCGRVLRQSVVAERDHPPFDRVMMDGIAFSHGAFAAGVRNFPIQAMQAAGDPVLTLAANHCIEIMTGAMLPVGADCVVPVERIEIRDGVASIESDYLATQHQFVHARGSDHKQGSVLLQAGWRVAAADVAIIASCGLNTVDCSAVPTIQVISTGNELVPPGAAIAPHQVRMSNGPAIVALLEQHGFDSTAHDHIVDDPAILRDRIGGHLATARVLVLSGGVSKGKADFLPGVLGELGVEVVFHSVSQRPGKPMWFGVGPEGQAVFALPGNPVSALICCRQYVVPALQHAAGLRTAAPEFASLAQAVSFAPKLTFFLPVKLASGVTGQTLAIPVHTNTSGDFTSLTGTAGYVELAPEQTEFLVGSGVQLRRW